MEVCDQETPPLEARKKRSFLRVSSGLPCGMKSAIQGHVQSPNQKSKEGQKNLSSCRFG
jgi:hypothetical protein